MFNAVIDRSDLSPDFAKKIVEQSHNNQEIIDRVMRQTIDKYEKDEQDSGVLWQEIFEHVCLDLMQKDKMEELLQIVSTKKLTTPLNLILLGVGSKAIAQRLPLK
ncbi:MAG: hypothetical protein ACRCXC_04825 [Legionella sp.]